MIGDRGKARYGGVMLVHRSAASNSIGRQRDANNGAERCVVGGRCACSVMLFFEVVLVGSNVRF